MRSNVYRYLLFFFDLLLTVAIAVAWNTRNLRNRCRAVALLCVQGIAGGAIFSLVGREPIPHTSPSLLTAPTT